MMLTFDALGGHPIIKIGKNRTDKGLKRMSTSRDTTNETTAIRVAKPKLKLSGIDGNAFSLLGAASKAWAKSGNTAEDWKKIRDEAISGDYKHLLKTLGKHFEVS